MKTLLPILILLAAGGVTVLLVVFKPEAAEAAPERPITSVEVLTVVPESVQLTVRSQGTVLPRTESDLSAEVSGRIIEVADSFRAGGSFRQGDVLVKIDPSDYEAAVAASRAELANAELALAQETALAEQAAADWAALGQGEPSDLTLRKPQLAQAEAAVESARANLKRAERDLARTELAAPFDGRVLSTSADLGQFISAAPATPVARIFATDRAEVRLPVTAREAERLETRDRRRRYITLEKANTPDSPTWTAHFARLEATIDPETRLLYVVAALDAPFKPTAEHPEPLRRGQFVNAVIEGRALSDTFVLPRYALRGSDTVYVATPQDTLETRRVEIAQSDAEQVIISGGLEPGDRIVLSPIAYYVENMPVEVLEE
ncbi:MAG: efflux RND transporter periplasmic adaptor subunit [Verrucomicrobia bacterium]|jgi:RND family efflux transporter MFP subunit|nr:efflux RND transporter periplasmic adaptor subunit [Verrucomicrobiota bacterium]